MWEKCLSCDSISTARNFTTKACQETFKIQSGLLNVTPKKFFIYYNSKSLVANVTRLEKQKQNLILGSTVIIVNVERLKDFVIFK